MFRRAKVAGRAGHRFERRQGVELKPAGKAYKVTAFGTEPFRPTASSTAPSSTARAVADAIRRLFDEPQHQDQGRRRLAVGQRRHRQEDLAAGHDRRRARRVDLLGGRAVHPLRHPGRQPRLPDPRPRRRRGGQGRRWTSCWWRRRRRRSPTTPASSRQAGRTAVVVDVDAFALQNAYEVNYGIEPDAVVVLLNAGASATNINILQRRSVGLHPRHLDRRQRLHRGAAEGAEPAVRAGRSAEARPAGRRRHLRGCARRCCARSPRT